jgi:hypothetical protein
MRKNASRPVDAENPEWTAEEMRAARPLMEVLPKEVVEAIRRYRGQRGPQKTATKEGGFRHQAPLTSVIDVSDHTRRLLRTRSAYHAGLRREIVIG